MRKTILVQFLFFVFIVMSVDLGFAAEDRIAVGVRAGANFADKRTNFTQYDLFARYRLPWKISLNRWINMKLDVDSTAGILTNKESSDSSTLTSPEQKSAFIGSAGPDINFSILEEKVSIDGGVSAALLTDYNFRSRDFGGPFQFICHSGIHILQNWAVSAAYRFQHMSNAHIYPKNPGLNLHMFELVYKF